MGQTIFNELKDEFDIELHETLKNYCDAIWCTYKITKKEGFVKTIDRFLNKMKSKGNELYFDEKILGWSDKNYFIDDFIHKCLFKTIKVTYLDNIKSVNNIYYIINYDRIFKLQDFVNDKFDILILEHPLMFNRVYEFVSIKIFKNNA